MAIALTPSFHESSRSCETSSTVVSSGRLTVFEMAPEMKGWTAPIIFTWPMWWMARSPIAQSKTG